MRLIQPCQRCRAVRYCNDLANYTSNPAREQKVAFDAECLRERSRMKISLVWSYLLDSTSDHEAESLFMREYASRNSRSSQGLPIVMFLTDPAITISASSTYVCPEADFHQPLQCFTLIEYLSVDIIAFSVIPFRCPCLIMRSSTQSQNACYM